MTTTDEVQYVTHTDDHILLELGFGLDLVGDEWHGSAPVVPELFAPGTRSVRTSILAIWADTVAGYTVMDRFAPRVPVTLDLDVQVFAPPRESETINVAARLVKAGRSVGVVEVEFTGSGGDRIGFAVTSFMAAPNPALVMAPDLADLKTRPRRSPGRRLSRPLAERARCEILAPGVATLPRAEDAINASNTINGGLLALTAEEAALSLTPGETLASLGIRYLRPARVGPVVATALVRDGLGRVEVRDTGADNRLAVLATTRTFGRAR